VRQGLEERELNTAACQDIRLGLSLALLQNWMQLKLSQSRVPRGCDPWTQLPLAGQCTWTNTPLLMLSLNSTEALGIRSAGLQLITNSIVAAEGLSEYCIARDAISEEYYE
jgi:hypothetical protein